MSRNGRARCDRSDYLAGTCIRCTKSHVSLRLVSLSHVSLTCMFKTPVFASHHVLMCPICVMSMCPTCVRSTTWFASLVCLRLLLLRDSFVGATWLVCLFDMTCVFASRHDLRLCVKCWLASLRQVSLVCCLSHHSYMWLRCVRHESLIYVTQLASAAQRDSFVDTNFIDINTWQIWINAGQRYRLRYRQHTATNRNMLQHAAS